MKGGPSFKKMLSKLKIKRETTTTNHRKTSKKMRTSTWGRMLLKLVLFFPVKWLTMMKGLTMTNKSKLIPKFQIKGMKDLYKDQIKNQLWVYLLEVLKRLLLIISLELKVSMKRWSRKMKKRRRKKRSQLLCRESFFSNFIRSIPVAMLMEECPAVLLTLKPNPK